MYYNSIRTQQAIIDNVAAVVNGAVQNLQKKSEAASGDLSYKELLQSLQTETVREAASTETTTADMTMYEYKIYFTEKLNAIPFHPNRQNDEEIINISDAGWEALKNDPEYEKEMLDGIAKDRMAYNPLIGTSSHYTTRNIGASMKEYRGACWSKEYGFGGSDKSKKVFESNLKADSISVRAKKRKRQQELDEKYYEQKMLMQEMSERAALIRRWQAGQAGLIDTANTSAPITGVPAEILLAGLGGGPSL